jgi:hypothetical protein
MPPVPFALGPLLRDGPAPLAPPRPPGDPFTVVLVLGPGVTTPRAAGLPPELLKALAAEEVVVEVRSDDDVAELRDRPPTPQAEETEGGALRIGAPEQRTPGPLARADAVLAAGWAAAPAVLTLPGLRARAVLLTADPPPLAEAGWTDGVPVLGTAWLGGDLPLGVDSDYAPLPVHRREDLVLVHGEEPFGLLAAAELHRRRDDLQFAVSGVRADLELPFPFLGVEPGAEALSHAFASAAVAFAPPVRGWRPAALAMLACGQPVVAPDDAAARAALGADTAILAGDPLRAAHAAEHLIADWTDRAQRVRAGLERTQGAWSATARALAVALRAL